MGKFIDRLTHTWNAFKDPDDRYSKRDWSDVGATYGQRPDRVRLSITNERSIVASIINRIGIDVASVDLLHVRLDENDRYLETINSGLNNCLTLEANIDQEARAFQQELVMSLLDEGFIAIVPVETSVSPMETGGYDIRTLRIGVISQWEPQHVWVKVYNENTGMKQEIRLSKRVVAIVQNPLYQVMNEGNSTLKRLTRKLNLLDVVDEQSSSGKLDIIIQLPYSVKSDTRRDQAEKRLKDIEVQMRGSQYGIAYADSTEKITQLNRPAENNLLKQVEYLTQMLYGQLGLTEDIMNGTADEATMVNYYNRTVEPILGAIAGSMRRTFLTKTARSQRQSIEYYRDPFRLMPISQIAEIADKFTRNEIASSNEFRGAIGMKPSKDPRADELVNKNIPEPVEPAQPAVDIGELKQIKPKEGDLQNGS